MSEVVPTELEKLALNLTTRLRRESPTVGGDVIYRMVHESLKAAKLQAYEQCAVNAGRRADQLERCGSGRYARECRQFELAIRSMIHSLHKEST